jgi:hypothetical protein
MQSHEELAVVVWPSYTLLAICTFPCDTEGLPLLLQQHIPCHICVVRLPLLLFSSLLFSCLCMKNSSLGTSFPTSLIQQVRYAHHDLPTVWRIKLTRLASPPSPQIWAMKKHLCKLVGWFFELACCHVFGGRKGMPEIPILSSMHM